MTALLPAAEEMLDAARELCAQSPADETEVRALVESDQFVRYADTGPTQSATRGRLRVELRARLADGERVREARVALGSLERAATAAALERALALARVSPPAELLPLGGAVTVPETSPIRPTADHTVSEKAAWAARAIDACAAAGCAPAGLARTTTIAAVLANSSGREVCGHKSRASLALTASGPSGSGWAEEVCSDVNAVDAERVCDRAVETARRAQDPGDWETGPTTVVLAPAAVSAILLFAGYRGFGAREVSERSSFLCGRVGERVLAESISIADDCGNALYPGLPFDAEGSPRERVELVTAGVLGAPVTDRHWAAQLGVGCSGHASDEPLTPAAMNLVVAAGEESVEDLVAGVDRGLFVSQFHYTNMIEPRELTLTGMTRNGTFRIDRGRLGAPVRNLRFTQSLVEALANVTGVGRDRAVAGALFDGEIVAPALRIDSFRFTSTTDF